MDNPMVCIYMRETTLLLNSSLFRYIATSTLIYNMTIPTIIIFNIENLLRACRINDNPTLIQGSNVEYDALCAFRQLVIDDGDTHTHSITRSRAISSSSERKSGRNSGIVIWSCVQIREKNSFSLAYTGVL